MLLHSLTTCTKQFVFFFFFFFFFSSSIIFTATCWYSWMTVTPVRRIIIKNVTFVFDGNYNCKRMKLLLNLKINEQTKCTRTEQKRKTTIPHHTSPHLFNGLINWMESQLNIKPSIESFQHKKQQKKKNEVSHSITSTTLVVELTQ